MLALVTHWVGCLWFFIGFASILNNHVDGQEALSPRGSLRHRPEFLAFPSSSPGAFGDSWLLRHFGPRHETGRWPLGADPVGSIAWRAGEMNISDVISHVDVGQIYATSIYWSLTMLMKSPHIGPDTGIEKLFGCLMVLLGLFVTTQIVAVVTQMVLSFDKAGSTFRDRQQEYIRFASSRALPPPLRRKLLKFSLQDWGVNQGFDPYDVIRQHRLPPALTHSILSAIYDEVIQESPFLKCIDTPVLHELLKYVKTVISLQKETVINQSDPCTRLYILRTGSLQASATDKLMKQATGGGDPPEERKTKGKMAKQSTWKQKMQVRMIERPGELICAASPFDPPQPLPFQITSLSKTTLLAIHIQDLLTVLDIVSEKQVDAVCKQMRKEHQNILLSVMPKTKDPNLRDSRVSCEDGQSSERSPVRLSEAEPRKSEVASDKRLSFDEGDLGERRLQMLERDIDKCIASMAALHRQAKAIPRMVEALSKIQSKPMQPMGKYATAALQKPGASPPESELDALAKEVADA